VPASLSRDRTRPGISYGISGNAQAYLNLIKPGMTLQARVILTKYDSCFMVPSSALNSCIQPISRSGAMPVAASIHGFESWVEGLIPGRAQKLDKSFFCSPGFLLRSDSTYNSRAPLGGQPVMAVKHGGA
jgi:hypothetical protein